MQQSPPTQGVVRLRNHRHSKKRFSPYLEPLEDRTTPAAVLAPGGDTTAVLSLNGDLLLGENETYQTLHVQVDGRTPGALHDQVDVTGQVRLETGARLQVDGAIASNAGPPIVLIANDGDDLVEGIFDGLPEDSSISIGGVDFRISYRGGSGNDVVLKSPDALPPVTVFELKGVEGTKGFFRSNVVMTLTATDELNGSGLANTCYSVDGVLFTNSTGPVTFTEAKNYRISFYSTDFAGNVEETKTIQFTINTNGPFVTSVSESLATQINEAVRQQGRTSIPTAIFDPGSMTLISRANIRRSVGSFAYKVNISTTNYNTPSAPQQSTLRLFEQRSDGSVVELKDANAPIAEIGMYGGGRFNVWRETEDSPVVLYFSPSDAGNPTTNGRTYFYLSSDDATTNSDAVFATTMIQRIRVDFNTTIGNGGRSFLTYAAIPGHADSFRQPNLSTLRLFEIRTSDGSMVELIGAHAKHTQIRGQGQGLFSHWQSGYGQHLYLSSTDNTDPRLNGRIYVVLTTHDANSDRTATVTNGRSNQHTTLLMTTNPTNRVIRISNPSTQTISNISIKVNGDLLSSSTIEILRTVNLMIPAYAGEPFHQKLFRYVHTTMRFGNPLSGAKWLHEPSLMLNSIGYGICDDFATVFSFLARAAKYQVRVWALNNHIVQEVLNSRTGRWEMYDPSFGVYFLRRDGLVAQVQDLIADPDLILNPVRRMTTSQSLVSPYSNVYASFFRNVRGIIPEYMYTPTRERRPLFSIPAGGSISIGYQGAPSPVDLTGRRSRLVSPTLSYTIPANNTFTLTPQLVLSGFRGQGWVIINRTRYLIGSPQLQTLLNRQAQLYTSITVIAAAKSPVIVDYLLNANRFNLGTEGIFNLTSVTVSGLNAHNRVAGIQVDWAS